MLPQPYLLFLGDVTSAPFAKTAFGIRDWAGDAVVGQYRLPGCAVDLHLPDLTPREAANSGAASMLIGVAPLGGAIPVAWHSALLAAIDAGLDLVSGLHTRLSEVEPLRTAAQSAGRRLIDVRVPPQTIPIATGRRRAGKRLLTVGTDCASGKKYTALAIYRALQRVCVPADFRATGQTGIMISGSGVPIDSVVADFISGAAETLSPDAASEHWDIIEGQGSLFHPAYAGVTLGLIHGSQPDAMVLCHDPFRKSLNGYADYPLPDLKDAMRRYVEAARLTNPSAKMVGISLNTASASEDHSQELLHCIELEHGLPTFDPLRSDLSPLVTKLIGDWSVEDRGAVSLSTEA